MFFLDKTVKRNVFGNDSYDKPAILDYKKVDFWMAARLESFKEINPWFQSKIG